MECVDGDGAEDVAGEDVPDRGVEKSGYDVVGGEAAVVGCSEGGGGDGRFGEVCV